MPTSASREKENFRSINPPAFIRLEGMNDLGRLACALERTPLPLFALDHDGKKMIATQLDLFAGTPIFYYAYTNEVKHFLGYRTTANGEEVVLEDSPNNPSMVHAPVIELVKLPPVFQKGLRESGGEKERKGQKFLSLQVKDLVSLVKVATYKILFEEPPLPIFIFPSSKKWRIGSFTRIEDYEEASIFFYYEENEKPVQNFVRYSMTRADASLTNRTDEHGNFYVKMIRLAQTHPLVETE
ncbi:MAG: hypothetical protein ACRECH_10550 [Nitrososphaerales archaeon]